MTTNEMLAAIQTHVYISYDRRNRCYWASTDSFDNPTPGATRFPIKYECDGLTRKLAVEKLYQQILGDGGLVVKVNVL